MILARPTINVGKYQDLDENSKKISVAVILLFRRAAELLVISHMLLKVLSSPS